MHIHIQTNRLPTRQGILNNCQIACETLLLGLCFTYFKILKTFSMYNKCRKNVDVWKKIHTVSVTIYCYILHNSLWNCNI